MKTIAFIFHQRAAYAVDWKTLTDNTESELHFILVSNQDCIDQMNQSDLSIFKEIINVKQFEFNELAPAIDSVLVKIYNTGDKTRMAVLSEFTMSVVAKLRDHLREKYNVEGPGHDIIDNFRDKLKMKKILGEKGVRLPKYQQFDGTAFKNHPTEYVSQLEKAIDYPMFVKPTNSAGSIGTAYIKDRSALLAWGEQAANDAQPYEVDEFIDGDLFHCDSIILGGKVQFTMVNQYLHPNADARHGKALASMAMNPATAEYHSLRLFAENILQHFPIIPDGFTHMEIFKNKKNELIFLEVAARAPGAKAPEVFKIRTGIDMRWLHLRLNLGLKIDDQLAHLKDKSKWGPYAGMVQLVAPLEGGVVVKRHDPVFTGSESKTDWKVSEGDNIEPNHSILDTVVSTLLWSKDYDVLEQDFKSLDQQQWITLAPRSDNLEISTRLYSLLYSSYQSVSYYTSEFFKKIEATSVNYAASVVNECESYFPENCPNYWGSGSPTIFSRNRSAANNACPTGQIAPPPFRAKLG